ncbi:MAG TPA: polysaccharide deacetylase [Janthinobacterium sp.]|nr:polysaccharide deacetylase [Janthinobacterium sp.]
MPDGKGGDKLSFQTLQCAPLHRHGIEPSVFNSRPRRFLFILRAIALTVLCAAPSFGRADAPAPGPAAAPAIPIRFLITFDDGPSAAEDDNPTVRILEALAHNAAQPGIKAIFFTQTRAANGGGSITGRKLLRREQDEGHLLAFHTATPHHANHRFLSPEELELSLQRGSADLQEVSGVPPGLVRPPFWNYDARTLAAYHSHGMQALLTDLSANDGKIWGVNFSWHKRSNMLSHLAQVRQRWRAGGMPVVDGCVPVVVTFHDVNTYTARHIEEYLLILLDVAHELDMPLAEKPFYDERGALEKAALARTVREGDVQPPLPGFWNWLWK